MILHKKQAVLSEAFRVDIAKFKFLLTYLASICGKFNTENGGTDVESISLSTYRTTRYSCLIL